MQPQSSVLVITDRIGEALSNGSQVFANALLLHLARWFKLTIIAQSAINPAEPLSGNTVVIPSTDNDQSLSTWLRSELDLRRFSLIYNLGATFFSCHVTRFITDLVPHIPLVNHFQVVLTEYAKNDGWKNEDAQDVGVIQQIVAERARKNIFISFAELSMARAAGWRYDKAYNCVIPNAFVKAGAERGVAPQDRCSFLAAGRFSDYVKGADLLYRAFVAVQKRHPTVRLEIASDEDRFLEILRPLPNDSWRFRGWLERKELHEAMSTANAVVMPSRYEPFGLVALEAMAMGTPVIAMSVGGLSEIVHHGRTGLLCPPNEGSLGLTMAMNAVAADLPWARQMGGNARREVKNFYRLPHIAQLVRLHLDNTLVANGAKEMAMTARA